MSGVILSHCHTLQMMDISPGNETLQSLITLCNSANKVIFISLSLPPSVSAGSEPPRRQQPPSAERDWPCVVLSSSDSEPELSLGKAQPLKSCKDKQSEVEEKEEDELPKDKQKLGEAEEEDKRQLKGKQSAGERGDNIAGGRLPPDHTHGNPTCNLLLFISREIGLCRVVTCLYNAV